MEKTNQNNKAMKRLIKQIKDLLSIRQLLTAQAKKIIATMRTVANEKQTQTNRRLKATHEAVTFDSSRILIEVDQLKKANKDVYNIARQIHSKVDNIKDESVKNKDIIDDLYKKQTVFKLDALVIVSLTKIGAMVLNKSNLTNIGVSKDVRLTEDAVLRLSLYKLIEMVNEAGAIEDIRELFKRDEVTMVLPTPIQQTFSQTIE